MSDDNELPVAELYRGVELYGLQSAERIAEARRQVDEVFGMAAPSALFAFACNDEKSPEARLLAKHKALASREDRQRTPFSVEKLEACTIGLERRTSQLGRLMGFVRADWPRAWIEMGDKTK